MGMQNIKDAGIMAERVSFALKQGDTKQALELLEQNYGPRAKELLERALKYTNMTPDEIGRMFSKISDYIENAVDKMEKHDRIKAEQLAASADQQTKAKEVEAQIAAERQKAVDNWQKFEKKLEENRIAREKLLTEKRKLQEQHKKEKDKKKRKKIEDKLKNLEKRRQKLEAEKAKLETLQKQNKLKMVTPDKQKNAQIKTEMTTVNKTSQILARANSGRS